MNKLIKIEPASDKPKFQQIIDAVIGAIKSGRLKHGQQLPSIAALAAEQKLAKATVARSYDLLCERGILNSRHGKGFYVSRTSVIGELNIFLLFDTFNPYKEILYRSFKELLPVSAHCTIFFHHYHRRIFESLIKDNLGKYTHYVIIPHFENDVSSILNTIPPDKLIVLDQEIKKLHPAASVIYQSFEKDTLQALRSAKTLIRKYNTLHLIQGKSHFQYVPTGIVKAFRQFAKEEQIHYRIENELTLWNITKGDAYLIFSDTDLIRFVKSIQTRRLETGKDIGLVSYDDTPLKEILLNGVSVISTDFREMGIAAVRSILDKEPVRIKNPVKFIKRKTL